MALPWRADRETRRTILAVARLFLLYIALCYVLLEIGFVSRSRSEAAPFLPQPSPIRTSTAYPARLAGMNVALEQYTDSSQRRAALQKLAAAGFGWVRQRADWRLLEPTPGSYAWAQMDKILADVAASGLEVVVVLDGSPAWARFPVDQPPTDNPFAPPAANANFARFATAFAQRYGQIVRFYQIWDEPNIAPHWGNRRIEPVAYGRMLAEVVPPIRAADTDAVILLAALAPTVDRGHTAIDEPYYLRRVYAAGAAPYFDAVAALPFGFGLPPSDPRSRVEILNFRRIGLLRRVMTAAGDGAKPVWAVGYGWNRSVNGVWQTVSAEQQTLFVEEATAQAKSWPWLAGLGWAVDRPAAPSDDPRWGFALYTPDGAPLALWDTFARVNRSPTDWAESQSKPHLGQLLFWLVALLGILWRGWHAGRVAQVGRWLASFASIPLLTRATAWLLLLAVYFFATWPPLIGICWLIAALFLAADPKMALVLIGLLLPFHYQHKEMQLLGTVLMVPPAYAILVCSLPGMVWRWFACSPKRWPIFHAADWLALGWLAVSLLSAGANWRWGETPSGLWSLALAPLLIYTLARTLTTTPTLWMWTVGGVAGGGVLATLISLVLWWNGDGTVVDGVRRLVGLTFSPNQMALMLVRVIFICLGLALVSRKCSRWVWGVGAGTIGVALLLTGSRGGLLLGVPTGMGLLMLLLLLRPDAQNWIKRHRGLIIPAVIVTAIAVFAILSIGKGPLSGERLFNSATVAQRLYIWQGALELWRAYLWLGSGPDGFFWHYPAFMTSAAANEPNLLHPHNIWLEFATGWGLPGLIWVMCLCYWLARRITRQAAKMDGIEAFLLVAFAAGIAHGQVDAFGALPELAAWNWLVMGLLASGETRN